jgi:hypothetical protein
MCRILEARWYRYTQPILRNLLSLERLCDNPRNLIDVMLNEVKHLAFSDCYEVEILRLRLSMTFTTQSPRGEGISANSQRQLSWIRLNPVNSRYAGFAAGMR